MLAFSSNCVSAEVAMLPDYVLDSALWGPLVAPGVLAGALHPTGTVAPGNARPANE